MKMRNVVFGDVVEILESTNSSSSSYGQNVLIDKESGQAIDSVFFEKIDLENDLGIDENAIEFECNVCGETCAIDELRAINNDNMIVAACRKCTGE